VGYQLRVGGERGKHTLYIHTLYTEGTKWGEERKRLVSHYLFPRLATNSLSSCLCLASAEIIGVYLCVQFRLLISLSKLGEFYRV
jgi:hypothetical protein